VNDHVYKQIKLTGSSTQSIENAVSNAIGKASATVKNMRWFQVIDTRGHIENDEIAHWQVTIEVGFTLED
jgi:dodecin